MEEKKEVTFEVKEGVMTITIDNPDTKNGLDWIGINQLADCYQYAMEHDDIMVMIITGNKQYFYTGGRVNPSSGESQKYADAIERLTTLQDKKHHTNNCRCLRTLFKSRDGDCCRRRLCGSP